MLHDAGMAMIYQVEEGGGPPPASPRLKEKTRQPFGERTVGVTRFYSAAAAGKTVSRLIEVWRDDRISTRDLCRIGERWYNIQQVVPAADEDGILVTRLTLEETDGSAWEGKYVDSN
ncbi:hypothetical protein [Lawsonibacter sp. JLR.KK007]|uniref:hypothetical protein n=1 Tax=Lawsonibacter sp. JLR.KK007 TaxID=3114293 RepID=UPI002FEECA87